jgi:hypothetical protein
MRRSGIGREGEEGGKERARERERERERERGREREGDAKILISIKTGYCMPIFGANRIIGRSRNQGRARRFGGTYHEKVHK